MKSNTCEELTDRTETYTITDFYVEPVSAKRTYAEHWKRVKRKLKVYLMLRRFANSATQPGLQIGRPSEILQRFSSLQSQSSDLPLLNKYVIIPYKNFYLFWIFLLGVCLLYISTYGILHYCYFNYFSDSLEALIEILIDSVFFVDILLSFHLSYFSKSNNLVKDKKRIAIHYLKTYFFFDLWAALPLGFILRANPDYEFYQVIMFRHIIKMTKWVKVRNKSMNFSFVREIDFFLIKCKEISHFIRVILVLTLSVHVISCLFYLSARAQNYDYSTWVYRSDIIGFSVGEKYLTSFYWAMVSMIGLGYGDIHPYTSLEKSISMVWMIIGIFVLSYSISKFTVIYQQVNKKYKTIETTLVLAEKFSSISKLPDPLKKRLKRSIRDQLIITQRMKSTKVLSQISLDLKHEIALNMHQNAISRIPFFTMKEKHFLSTFVFLLELVQFKSGEFIWLQKSSADGIFFISLGRVKFLYQGILFYVMREGEFFGDIEIFMKVERKFDAIACETSKCLKMTKEALSHLREHFPKYYNELRKMRKRRRKNVLDNLTQMVVLHRFYKSMLPCISRAVIKYQKKEIFTELFANDFYIIQKFRLAAAIKCVKETQVRIRSVKKMVSELSKSMNEVQVNNFLNEG
jgi:CRP-like cAMP-binding protein